MIFLDANVFLRYLVEPVMANDRTWHEQAMALFEALDEGVVEATTSEAVLAFDGLPGIGRWSGERA